MISSCAIAIVLAVAGALLTPDAATADPSPTPAVELPLPDILTSPTPGPTKTHKARKHKKQRPTPAPMAAAPTSAPTPASAHQPAPAAGRSPITRPDAAGTPGQEYALNPAARVTPRYRIPAPVLDISEAPAVDQSPTDTSLSIAIVAVILAAIFGTWLIMLVLGRGRSNGRDDRPSVQYIPAYPPAPNINIDFKPSWSMGGAPRVIEGETQQAQTPARKPQNPDEPTGQMDRTDVDAFLLGTEDRIRNLMQGDV